jgi:hypothetical protein
MRKSVVVLVASGLLTAFMGSEKPHVLAKSIGATKKDCTTVSNAAVPAALVGQWQSGSLATASFYDPGTQQWNEPTGRGIFLIVEADGAYRFGAGEQIATTHYFLYQEGTVTINESQMVFSPQIGSEYTRETSAPQRHDQHAATQAELQPSTLKFKIVSDQGSSNLVLIDEHGEMITLRADVR